MAKIYRSQGLLKKINEVCVDDQFIDIKASFEFMVYKRSSTGTEGLFLKDLETLDSLCFIEYNPDFSKLRITKLGRDFAGYLC